MDQTTETKNLLKEIEKFLAPCPACGRGRMASTWFCQRAVGNGHLLERLRAGGNVRPETARRVRIFIRDF